MELYIALIAFFSALVMPSMQYDDRVLSLKEAAVGRLARRQRGKVNLNVELVSRSGAQLRGSIRRDKNRDGTGLRIQGEYIGPLGGSIQGSLINEKQKGLDFFRGLHRRRNVDASFDARLPSGAGVGGRARVRSGMNAGLTGVSGGYAGRIEGGINDAFGNNFRGGFQGGFEGNLRVPVVGTAYVSNPYGTREILIG